MNDVEYRLPGCVSCGSVIQRTDHEDSPDLQDAMRARCRQCALEVLGEALYVVGSLQHDTGGGRRVIRETKTH